MIEARKILILDILPNTTKRVRDRKVQVTASHSRKQSSQLAKLAELLVRYFEYTPSTGLSRRGTVAVKEPVVVEAVVLKEMMADAQMVGDGGEMEEGMEDDKLVVVVYYEEDGEGEVG